MNALVRKSLDSLVAVKNYVCSQTIEREDVADLMVNALLTKQHLFIVGPHGTGKSLTTTLFNNCISGSKLFSTQITAETTEEAVFGPIDLSLYRDESIVRYNTEGMLPSCNIAYLDEFMDGSPPLLRSLLELLEERKFTRGIHDDEIPLHTTVATTNFGRLSEKHDAVLDRFTFRVRIDRLDPRGRNKLISLVNKLTAQVIDERPTITLGDIHLLCAETNKVSISDDVIDDISMVVDKLFNLQRKKELLPSDRRIGRSLAACKASALLRGSYEVETEHDLMALRDVLIMRGNSEEEKEMSAALIDTVSAKVEKMKQLRVSRIYDSIVDMSRKAYDHFINCEPSIEQVSSMTELSLLLKYGIKIPPNLTKNNQIDRLTDLMFQALKPFGVYLR